MNRYDEDDMDDDDFYDVTSPGDEFDTYEMIDKAAGCLVVVILLLVLATLIRFLGYWAAWVFML